MNDLISVIVPVYNVSTYLSECIDSIIKQTYKKLEIILVDDGSTDNSASICDNYAKKDNRIKVIHKKNGGVSSTRNAGIDNANGKYICFIDSDDYILDNYIESLYNNMINDIDLVCCGYSVFNENETKNYLLNKTNNEKKILKSSILSLKYALNNNFYTARSCSAKIYKLDVIKNNNIRFNDDIYLLEDGIFNLKYLKYINKISIIEDALYYYRQIISSASHKYNDDQLEQYQKVEKVILNYIDNDSEKDYYYVICYQHLLTFISRNIRFKRNRKNNVKDIKFQCKNNYKDVIKKVKYSNLYLSEKVTLFLLKLRLYNILYFMFTLREKIK